MKQSKIRLMVALNGNWQRKWFMDRRVIEYCHNNDIQLCCINDT